MGYLRDGDWHTGWYEPDAQGALQRPEPQFRAQPSEIVDGRYHLYVAWACPRAHRTLITRSLRRLSHAIGVGSLMGDDGWPVRPEDPDPNCDAKCNLKRLRNHEHLWRFTRRMYRHSGIRPTCQLDEIKAHYY